MLNCREISELVSRAQDEHLRWRERVELRLHVMMCRHCAALQRNLPVIGRLIADHGGHAPDDEWYRALEAGIDRALKEQRLKGQQGSD